MKRLLAPAIASALLLTPALRAQTNSERYISSYIERAQIPLAAISPDGASVAYLTVTAEVGSDTYSGEIVVRSALPQGSSRSIARFELTPQQVWDELHWLRRNAADLRWIDNAHLLYVSRSGGKPELRVWSLGTASSHLLLRDYDNIEIERGPAEPVAVLASRERDRDARGSGPRDDSILIDDSLTFIGAGRLQNDSAQVDSARWHLAGTAGAFQLRTAPLEEARPPSARPAQTQAEPGAAERVVTFQEEANPRSDRRAIMEYVFGGLGSPAHSYIAFRIAQESSDGRRRLLLPEQRSFVYDGSARLLGWSRTGASLLYMFTDSTSTKIFSIGGDGNRHLVADARAALQAPCPLNRDCRNVDAARRFGLFVRTSPFSPDELVTVDLRNGAVQPIASPNAHYPRPPAFSRQRYFLAGADSAWAYLYRPSSAADPRRPLVISLYSASPGLARSVGDEVPIAALLNEGIAVLDVNVTNFNSVSDRGDFRMEVGRVQRPLDAVRTLVQQLHDAGVIDSRRVAMTGLSYGAEIGMFAVWNWPRLCAASMATASWDPALTLFTGAANQPTLRERGFPPPDALSTWSELSGAIRSELTIPPLLLQSPQGERNWTVPTWTRLRSRGLPVEWREYQDEGHVKIRPGSLWWVNSRNLDWLTFWLQDRHTLPSGRNPDLQRWENLRASVGRCGDR
jgi:dipeptidyl aminopeptidase/acylaminoacyl peptidase